jgi:hypothetical protein
MKDKSPEVQLIQKLTSDFLERGMKWILQKVPIRWVQGDLNIPLGPFL